MLINKRRYKNHRPLSFQGKLRVTLMEPLGFDGGILISGSPCGHVSQFRFNKTPACALKAAFPRPLRCWADYSMEEMSFGCRFHHLPIRLSAPAIWLTTGLFSFITHFREASTPWALFRKSIRNVNMLFALPSTQAESHPSCHGKPSLRGVWRAWCGSGGEGDSWEPPHLRSCGGLYVGPALWDAWGLLSVVAVLSQLRPGFQAFPFCSQVSVCLLVRQCSVQGNSNKCLLGRCQCPRGFPCFILVLLSYVLIHSFKHILCSIFIHS